jgi:hypothetical protein
VQSGMQQNKEKGSALVEFAFALITILVVLYGIIDMGRALYAYDWVANAARQGTRFASVRGAFCTKLPVGCPARASDVRNYVNTLAVGINTSDLDVTTVCFVGANFPSPPPCAPKGWVRVTVQYRFRFISPLVPLAWNMQSGSKVIVQN